MTINQKNIKLLWGRSGNRCAICRIILTQDKTAASASFTLGEQAHIIGEKDDAARGRSILTEKERNSYHNLILLCPNHHTEIDSNEAEWPVEKLHQIKLEHELWVTETLSETINHFKIAKDTATSSIIDAAVTLCRLDEWRNWTSFALAADPQWPKELPDEIWKFWQKVVAAIWPEEFDELKRASQTLSILLHRAAQKFREHSERHGEILYPHKFYKSLGWNENYDRDGKIYDNWIDDCHNLIREATKAANWFADSVRKEINPMFFAEKGKFLIEHGPFVDLSFHTELLEYSEDEKSNLPNSLQNSA